MWQLLLVVPLLASAATRPISFRDIVEMRDPVSPRISPDGLWVAYVLRQSSIEKNSTQSSFWIVGPDGSPRRLLEESPAGDPVWLPDSSALIVRLPARGKQPFWRLPVNGGSAGALFEHADTVSAAWWSPDASRLLFVSAKLPDAQERQRAEREGMVYDETVHGIRNFTRNTWVRPPTVSLWLWRAGESRAERLTLNPADFGAVRSIRWHPSGDRVLVEYSPRQSGNVNATHLGVLEGLAQGGKPAFRALVTTATANRGACWHPGENNIFFAQTGEPGRYFAAESRFRSADVRTGKIATVPVPGRWYFVSAIECDGKSLLVEYENQSTSSLYRIEPSTGKIVDAVPVGEHLSAFHFTPDHRWAACVRQSITSPPEIARVELATGRVETLTRLNPELANVALVPATERRWRNQLGNESNGFLFLPPGVRKPPLVLIQYNFSNRFTTQAQWMTSYPVQHLVAAGIAVLLHNYPRELGWKPGDFAGAMLSQAQNPIASMETAVASLVEEGTVDSGRTGIAGWSFGAWLAELAITQTDLFRTASAGEGGLNNAGQYWVTGSRAMQDYLDAFFGGPPFGPAYENYRRLAPALNAHRVRVPLLREYGTDVGVQSLEFYMALRRLGKPVEQIIYPGAPHILDRPSQRLASLERNLDWFRFWLQGVEDPDPKKSEQYRRWRLFRQNLPK